MARVLVVMTEGSEEIETITPVDLLRRAGAEVTLGVSGESLQVTMSRGIKVEGDALIRDVAGEDWDMIVLPGGPGARKFNDDEVLIERLKQQKANGKWYCAICASPAVVFEKQGLLEGEKATTYPAHEATLTDQSVVSQRVFVSNKCISSKSPGTAMEFALELINALFGEEKKNEIADMVLAKP